MQAMTEKDQKKIENLIKQIRFVMLSAKANKEIKQALVQALIDRMLQYL